MGSNSAQFAGLIKPLAPPVAIEQYRDILHHARPVATNHPPMSRANRAAQFMPFAALVGYEELVAQVEDENTFTGNVIIPDVEQLEFDKLDICDDFPDFVD